MQVTDVLANAAAETANHAPVELEITGEPTAVYRFYGADGNLLYVGITNNLNTRWTKHAAEKTWWLLVAKRTVVMYGSRAEASAAEDKAILAENPVHNIQGREEKKPVIPKQPSRLPDLSADPTYFHPDAKTLFLIDLFAKDRGLKRGDAFGLLLIKGMIHARLEGNETLEELDAEAAALDAINAELPVTRRR